MSRITAGLVSLVAIFAGFACASSKSGETSTDPERPAIQERQAADSEQADGNKPVRFHTLLDDRPEGSPLPGCETRWDEVNRTPFGIPGRFCARFRAGKPYGKVPLSVALEDGEVVGVHVQLLHGEVQQAKSQYDELVGQFLGECTRKTGGDQHEIVDCEDYAVQIGWQLRHDQPEVYLFYARNAKRILEV